MIKELVLPHRALSAEELVDQMRRPAFDESKDLGQAPKPSFCIPERCEKKMNVIRHNDECMQLDLDSIDLPAAVEHNNAGPFWNLPAFVSRKCHEDRTVVFDDVRQSAPVGVFPIQIHIHLNTSGERISQ